MIDQMDINHLGMEEIHPMWVLVYANVNVTTAFIINIEICLTGC